MDSDRYFVYGISSCPYCSLAKEVLQSLKKDFIFYDLGDDMEFLSYTKGFYNHPTVPIIIKNNKDTGACNKIGGFDELSKLLGET